eukprot:TRINITY_DN11378_c0_g1_i2.p1 TRINITY_DN11378_c0_g1~~TRINITY_DN11378_c0_g1_i2.p1  ORF type:complete len:714 (-),score=232.73 TRINITY_DN11378_c0_g1_i2:230-2371(-)
MASLHPAGALFEGTYSHSQGRNSHRALRNAIASHGVEVVMLADVLSWCSQDDLVGLACECLTYELADSCVGGSLAVREELLLGDAYKRRCLFGMDKPQLIETILSNPTVVLEKSDRNTPVRASSYRLEPLGNLVFTRDQMIVTARGAVLGRMGTIQRQREVRILEFVLQKLGVRVAGRIPEGMTLEGGDFIPASPDLCFIGTGIRTSMRAIEYLMVNDLLGYKRVAVVRDMFDRQQDRMHLDCVFNIAHNNVAVYVKELMGADAIRRRLVHEYVQQEDGTYALERVDVEFTQYLRDHGYHIIELPEAYQEEFGINFVSMGQGKLIAIHQPSADLIASDPEFQRRGGSVVNIDFSGVTKMFGGAHCGTQVFRNRYRGNKKKTTEMGHTLDMIKLNSPYGFPLGRQSHVLMVAPTTFAYNSEASRDNKLMHDMEGMSAGEIRTAASHEFSRLVYELRQRGIVVHLFKDDNDDASPDSVFPNSWFTTHNFPGLPKMMMIYPMKAASRRTERSNWLVDYLKSNYSVTVDLSGFEAEEKYLEGGGSIVSDSFNKLAYMVLSDRSSVEVGECYARILGRTLHAFRASHPDGSALYHTTLVIAICGKFAIVCGEAIGDEQERTALFATLHEYYTAVVDISLEQAENFCACVQLLHGAPDPVKDECPPFLVLSDRAYNAFTPEQLQAMQEAHEGLQFLHVPLDVIENVGGGSVRSLLGRLT